MTLREACTAYEKHAALHLRPRTASNRRSLLRRLVDELGDVSLEEIDAEGLEAYTRARLATLRPVSVNTELRAYGSLRSWALAGGIEVGAAPKQVPERAAFRVCSWSPAEVRRLFAAIDEHAAAIRDIVFAIANTGMRCGEALALKWENVDEKRRLIRIWPSAEWTTKSGKPREVPINDALARLLAKLPRRSPYVFPSRKGSRWSRWPQRAFERARDAAGLEGGPHKLRHSYATEFLARGGSIEMLAQILGHSDERTTRIYAHLRPEHLVAARNVVVFDRGWAVRLASLAGSLAERVARWASRAVG